MDRKEIKKTLADGFETGNQSYFDLDDTYRIYCYVDDNNGFWDTCIHMAIDNNFTREIDLFETYCDMCDKAMFEENIDWLLNKYEEMIKK